MRVPSPSRRSVIAASASFFGGVAVGSLPIPARATVSSQGYLDGETQAFSDAIQAVDAAVIDFRLAEDGKTAARARYDAVAPALPDELRAPKNAGHWNGDHSARRLQDVEGKDVLSDPTNLLSEIPYFYASGLRLDVEDYSARTALGKSARRLLPIAEAYDAEVEAAKAASGIDAAIDVVGKAVDGVRNAVDALMQIPAMTPAGVLAKIMACERFKDTDREYPGASYAIVGIKWLPSLIADADRLSTLQA